MTDPGQKRVQPAPRWEHFTHVADVGVRGFGATMAQAFEQAALALTAVITEPGTVRARRQVDIACEAPDPGILLADWLNALVFEMATRKLLFGRFQVQVTPAADGLELTATAWGEPIDTDRHQPAVEIKGATYTALSVTQQPDGTWSARCVVDV